MVKDLSKDGFEAKLSNVSRVLILEYGSRLVSRSLSIGIYIGYWSPPKSGILGSKTVGSQKIPSPQSKAVKMSQFL